MPKITIDEVEYNTEDLSDNGKLKSEIAVYQTARNSYVTALKNELED